ncbi:MAG: VWA domain-containing protein [Erysipelothrix sp.]|nr:VWA domain-containing protein [Erysipelothrix sp.]
MKKIIHKLSLVFTILVAMLLMTSVTKVNAQTDVDFPDPTADNQVTVDKTAGNFFITDKVNMWDVFLDIKAIDVTDTNNAVPTDVVLVLDISGSMSGSRITAMRAAAGEFIDIFRSSPNIGIGLVAYDSSIYSYPDLGGTGNPFARTEGEKDALKGTISGLWAGGTTNTAGAIDAGKLSLDMSTATNKMLVVLSDGYPNDEIAGVASADAAKGAGYVIHSIGFDLFDDYTKDFMSNISSGTGYYHETADNISGVFSNIATVISTRFGVENGQVVDVIAPGFQLVPGSIVISQGSVEVVDNTITWTLGKMAMRPPLNEEIYKASMSYQVEINDEILGVTPVNHHYPTNTSAVLTDLANPSMTRDFPIPEVNPVLLHISKGLVDQLGGVIENTTSNFTINVSSSSNEFGMDTQLKANQTAILTFLRDLGTDYVVMETGSDDDKFDDYLISYFIDGVITGLFEVELTDELLNDIYIDVINEEFVIQKIDIEMDKVWVSDLDEHPDIDIQLYRDGVAHLDPIRLEDGQTSYTWVGLDETDGEGVKYVYTVDEVAVPEGFVKEVNGFTITNTQVTLPDTSTPTLPDTGSMSSLSFIMFGSGSFMLGSILIALKKINDK